MKLHRSTQRMKRRILRFLRAGALALPALVLVLIGLSVVSNLTLPTRLASTGRLADLEKARLAETRAPAAGSR